MALFRVISWERIVLNCVTRGPSFMLLMVFSHAVIRVSSLDMQWKKRQLGYAVTLSFNNLLVLTDVNLQKEDIFPLELFCKEFSCSLYSAWTYWCRGKQPASTTNGANNATAKKGRGAGGLQNQLVIEHWKVYLMVEEVVWGAEARGGEDVGEEEATCHTLRPIPRAWRSFQTSSRAQSVIWPKHSYCKWIFFFQLSTCCLE